MLPNGAPKRLDTYIDIPLEIGLPHFISDEGIKDEGPLFGNFKLVLQSAVCHRGVSVDSGHYIALVRADCNERPSTSRSDDAEQPEAWLRFDDLSQERVTKVDIKKALQEESPYLLFYQVQPINEELAARGDPPSYMEAQSAIPSVDPSRETLASVTSASVTDVDVPAEASPELDHSNEPLSRNSVSSIRRNSIVIEDVEGDLPSASRGGTQPQTPDDQKNGFLSASRRSSRIRMPGSSKSRSSSPMGENRLSLTISRLTGRGSKDKLQAPDIATIEEPDVTVDGADNTEQGQQARSPSKDKKDVNISRSKSKKEKKEKNRSKSRDLGHGVETGKHKDKNRPDRECNVM